MKPVATSSKNYNIFVKLFAHDAILKAIDLWSLAKLRYADACEFFFKSFSMKCNYKNDKIVGFRFSTVIRLLKPPKIF